ncbi:MAG: hypothetical protein COA67_01570 [Lutibacter sp.]|nr:MAG: hypothetical protein COA67_01570 [Lutibacter sp.]
MNKTIFLILLIIAASCNNSSGKKNSVDNSIEENKIESKETVNIRDFDNELRLFLDFYQGMNFKEFRQRSIKEVNDKRLYYRNKDSKNRKEMNCFLHP